MWSLFTQLHIQMTNVNTTANNLKMAKTDLLVGKTMELSDSTAITVH